MQPDFGPPSAPPKSGIVVVGACPWVMNYNVPLVSTDLEKAKQIARRVSERGGGLPNVQAMALLHGDNCIEIACNLLDMDVSGPDVVQCIVATLAAKEGIKANPGYLTGHSKQEILQLAMEKLDISHKLWNSLHFPFRPSRVNLKEMDALRSDSSPVYSPVRLLPFLFTNKSITPFTPFPYRLYHIPITLRVHLQHNFSISVFYDSICSWTLLKTYIISAKPSAVPNGQKFSILHVSLIYSAMDGWIKMHYTTLLTLNLVSTSTNASTTGRKHFSYKQVYACLSNLSLYSLMRTTSMAWLNFNYFHIFQDLLPLPKGCLRLPTTARGDPAVSYRWTGWVWGISGWSSRLSGELVIILEESVEYYTSNEWKQKRKMSTCNRLDSESHGSWLTMPKNFPGTAPNIIGDKDYLY